MSQQQLPAPSAVAQGPPIKDITKACEACRSRKIKCKPSLSSSSRICECCATSNRECIFVVRSNKRRRRRTDVRVTELEKQIEALGALVNQRNPIASEKSHGLPADDDVHTSGMAALMQFDQLPGQGTHHNQEDKLLSIHQAANSSSCSSTSAIVGAAPRILYENPIEDVIDRGLVSIKDAEHLLMRYIQELVPHFPIVPLPEDVTLSDMRRRKPVLLLSVLAAAAGTAHADQNMKLNLEIQQTYADLVVMKGEKSLELLQSILITTTWLYPPDRFDQLKFYQYLRKSSLKILYPDPFGFSIILAD
ncbi:MAG: hypothetical protein Q9198_001402 [Flavoplaca austrocitrina]